MRHRDRRPSLAAARCRPFWGHDYHFHIRIGCQPGSTGCKAQDRRRRASEGCDKSLAWWFTDEPWRPNKNPDAPKARDLMTMASLPRQCRAVLEAAAPVSEASVTIGGFGVATAAAPSAASQDAAVPVNSYAAEKKRVPQAGAAAGAVRAWPAWLQSRQVARHEPAATARELLLGRAPGRSQSGPHAATPLRLTSIAHDETKAEMVAYSRRHAVFMGGCDIVATGTTGQRVAEACAELTVRRLKSGPLGGDQQIGADRRRNGRPADFLADSFDAHAA